jgi:hypothetical protein
MRASGQVAVQVFVDETGNVTAAKATPEILCSARLPKPPLANQESIPIIVGDRAVKATALLFIILSISNSQLYKYRKLATNKHKKHERVIMIFCVLSCLFVANFFFHLKESAISTARRGSITPQP